MFLTSSLGLVWLPTNLLILQSLLQKSLYCRIIHSLILVFCGQTPISWKFGKQRTVVGSSTEVIWLQYLLIDLQVPSVFDPTIWCDNLGATYLSANPIFHVRTKHVEVDYHFIHDRVAKKEFRFLLSPLRINSQVLTKLLSAASFTTFRYKLRVDPLSSAWGGIL